MENENLEEIIDDKLFENDEDELDTEFIRLINSKYDF